MGVPVKVVLARDPIKLSGLDPDARRICCRSCSRNTFAGSQQAAGKRRLLLIQEDQCTREAVVY
jgi:hypothetical protein